jgi:hypothetical protein
MLRYALIGLTLWRSHSNNIKKNVNIKRNNHFISQIQSIYNTKKKEPNFTYNQEIQNINGIDHSNKIKKPKNISKLMQMKKSKELVDSDCSLNPANNKSSLKANDFEFVSRRAKQSRRDVIKMLCKI